jgi:hypothetical protein
VPGQDGAQLAGDFRRVPGERRFEVTVIGGVSGQLADEFGTSPARGLPVGSLSPGDEYACGKSHDRSSEIAASERVKHNVR